MSSRQNRWHLTDESKPVDVWTDDQSRLRADHTACGTTTFPDYIEPLHEFLRTANDTHVRICKNCLRLARPKVEDPNHPSHNLAYEPLAGLWNSARLFQGISLPTIKPHEEDAPVPTKGHGICAVCGGRVNPGTAVMHGTLPLRRCAPTERGAVHVGCSDRPIPYSYSFTLLGVS